MAAIYASAGEVDAAADCEWRAETLAQAHFATEGDKPCDT
jgi:hypothetical protein